MLQYGGDGLKEADSMGRILRGWLLAAAVGAGIAGFVAFLYRAQSPVPAVYGAGLGGGIVLANAWRRRVDRGDFGLGCGLAVMTAVLIAAVTHQLWLELPAALAFVGISTVMLLAALAMLPEG
jgi:hypothetical protein